MVDEHATTDVPRAARWRFSLGGLFALITTACVWLAFMSLRTIERELTFTCDSLPPNDHALIAWLQRNEGTRDVHATRDGSDVSVRIRKREFFGTFEGSMPPLEDLGYGKVETLGFHSTTGWILPIRAVFRWMYGRYWLVAAFVLATMLVVILLVRRRLGRASKVISGPQNPQRIT